MISSHVTYFILFHWSDIFFFPFLLHFHSSHHWHPRMLSRLCEFVIEVPHGLHWCIFYLILFMGGLFVFWSVGRSLLPLPPSPSLPWLSPELPFQRRASTLSPSPSCILWSDSCLSGCAPLCTMLCCAVFLWL